MIYILTQNYPSERDKYAMSYVHSRNLIYQEQKLEFIVVSMVAIECYYFEGVKVITKNNFLALIREDKLNMNDIILSHAPNIKNHITLINKIYFKVKKVIVFFHGHEVLKTSDYYPKNYKFNKESYFKLILRDIYDELKLKIMKRFIEKLTLADKLTIICVSSWMKKHASLCLNIDFEKIEYKIINNNANQVFVNSHYHLEDEYMADFVTVRPLDVSKYAIDLVVKFAISNPEFKFHVYGKGEYFNYNKLPKNMTVINEFISQKDFPALLNKYRCCLMPTRLDAQGVMVCEMATYGIPVITSKLEVCEEMFENFTNVYLAEEDFFSKNIDRDFINQLSSVHDSFIKFSIETTVLKEVNLLKDLQKLKV